MTRKLPTRHNRGKKADERVEHGAITNRQKKRNEQKIDQEQDKTELEQDKTELEQDKTELEQDKTEQKDDGREQKQDETDNEERGEDTCDGQNGAFPLTALLNAFVIVLAVIIISSGMISLFYNSNIKTDFEVSLKLLKSDFQNQTDETFKKLKSRMSRYIHHDTAPQPFVLLVASKQENHITATCFAKRVAQLLTTTSVIINGSNYAKIPSDDAKLEIDDHLRDVFQKNIFPTAAIIHNLDLIPYGTTNLFYAYCDHDHPMYKEAAIIFTITLPQNYHISDNEHDREGLVEKYLSIDSKWVKDKDFSIDVMGALISRITDTAVIINQENKESLGNLC